MRISAIFSLVLAAATSCSAVALTASGVYTLTIQGLALTHANATAAITATTPSGAASQAWTVVVAPGLSIATIQSASTRAFVATDGSLNIVPTTSAFTWSILTVNGQSLFCAGGSLCITLTSGVLSLSQAPAPGAPSQSFDVASTTPPRGSYQVQNQAANRIFGNSFVPSGAFLASFPATDRTEIWDITPTGSSISLQNLDTGGILSVASNGTVGAFDRSSGFTWSVGFVPGVGQTLQAGGRFLSISGTTLTTGTVADSTAVWVFQPVDPDDFLP